MSLKSVLFLALSLCSFTASAQDPVVQSVLDALSMDSMLVYVDQLTGEVPIDVGNGPQIITSRHKNNPGNDLAEVWLTQKLEQFGYSVVIQSFSATGRNILVSKQGTVPSAPAMILCAHYDAMPGGLVDAPAADDDGSGVAALLEAARVLSAIPFEHPITFAFWDEEEQGLVGSAFYAGGLASNDVLLRGVINMDALAWDGNGDKRARVHVRPHGNSVEIGDTLMAVKDHYAIDLDLVLTNPGATYSDHASFWNEGYGAVLVIEDFGADGNPYYHTPNDRVEFFDVPYFEQVAKLAIAGLATLAVPAEGEVGMEELCPRGSTITAFPNPTDGDAQLWLEVPATGSYSIVQFDAMGREVASLFAGKLNAGRHSFTIPLGTAIPGTYAVVVRANGSDANVVRVIRTP